MILRLGREIAKFIIRTFAIYGEVILWKGNCKVLLENLNEKKLRDVYTSSRFMIEMNFSYFGIGYQIIVLICRTIGGTKEKLNKFST